METEKFNEEAIDCGRKVLAAAMTGKLIGYNGRIGSTEVVILSYLESIEPLNANPIAIAFTEEVAALVEVETTRGWEAYVRKP